MCICIQWLYYIYPLKKHLLSAYFVSGTLPDPKSTKAKACLSGAYSSFEKGRNIIK